MLAAVILALCVWHNVQALPDVPCGAVFNSTWTVSEPCVATCDSPSCLFGFDTIHIAKTGELSVDAAKSIRMSARLFLVDGKLVAGTEDAPLTSQFDIVLTGRSADQDDPSVQKWVVGHGGSKLPYSKALVAGKGSTVSLHGKPKASWIKLASTAVAGSSTLELVDYPYGWEAGDVLLVPTTGMLQQVENEEVTLAAVARTERGARLTIKERLVYTHYGESADVRLNGEVGVLSHNIRIIGDNSDKEHQLCEAAFAGLQFLSRNTSAELRQRCYGGHMAMVEQAAAQLSNVEFRRMGQATRIARYPIHWHLAQDVASMRSYVSNSSIWESYQRCVTIHGTWGATVRDNVCYKVHGHAYYLEDAIEHANRFVRNLAVHVRRGAMVCTDGLGSAGPSAFWITNPNNTYVDNLAVDVGDRTSGMGYWIVSGGDVRSEDGPQYLYEPDFWKAEYAARHAGEVFNPSRTVYANDTAVPRWMLRQQQARTPLREFRGNGVRSSFRGVHIDGFITSSVPGEIVGGNSTAHGPEDLPVFEQREADGTCNYFPKSGMANPGAEGVRVYAPVHFDIDADGRAFNYTAAWSVIDGMHISRCYDTWWSRAARINITNSLFAWNWIGMTNENTGNWMCPGTGIGGETEPRNPGLAIHVVDSLFVGHGDEATNGLLCRNGDDAKHGFESPAGIRQYDGAFWLSNSRWVNMSTQACNSSAVAATRGRATIKSLPYALVSGRQTSCNEKWPIHLYDSWPLGASAADATSAWGWALGGTAGASRAENLAQFTGTAACSDGPAGGVVDMTGTLDPEHPSAPRTAYLAFETLLAQNGELAYNSTAEVRAFHYRTIDSTTSARVRSMAWAHQAVKNADFNHICGYCFYRNLTGRCLKPSAHQ